MRPNVILTVHAETLQREPVWSRVAPVARWIERQGVTATFFVYPFPAIDAGIDISDRVRQLAGAGHEIGQHTHFYAEVDTGKATKLIDLSEENVRRCIQRDLETLASMDVRPSGFVGGAWRVTPAILDVIASSGFAYDMSARFPKPHADGGHPDEEWMTSPHVYGEANRSLVRAPTTSSLGEWFRWGRRVAVEASIPFQVVYLHDYDLLRAPVRWMLNVFLRLNRARMSSTHELLDRLVPRSNG